MSAPKKRKSRRAVIKEPGPEAQELEVAPPAKVDAKSTRGGRPPLSEDARKEQERMRRLYRDLGAGGSSDDDFGGGIFAERHVNDFDRVFSGRRVTGESL